MEKEGKITTEEARKVIKRVLEEIDKKEKESHVRRKNLIFKKG